MPQASSRCTEALCSLTPNSCSHANAKSSEGFIALQLAARDRPTLRIGGFGRQITTGTEPSGTNPSPDP